MSRTEDYLDGLLNSLDTDAISQNTEAEREPREADLAETENSRNEQHTGEDYLDSLEKEILSGDSSDDFIRQFEAELAQEEADAGEGKAADPLQDDSLFDSLDGIVNSVKERMQDEDDIMVDTLGDLPEGEFGIPAMPDEPVIPADTGIGEFGSDDPEFEELFRTDGELPDIEDLIDQELSDTDLAGEKPGDLYDGGETEFPVGSLEDILKLDESAADVSAPASADTQETTDEENEKKKKGKKKEKTEKKEKAEKKDKVKKKEKGGSNGFLQKLSGALFEESEQVEQESDASQETEQMSDENLQILQQLEGDKVVDLERGKKAAADEKAKKKEAKKKERKEKKEAAKKEKDKKKKSKPKKEKKPKTPDKSKPLPKKPVFLIFAMTASFLALVLLGTKYAGYSGSRSRAADYYSRGDYGQAYHELSGLEIAKDDQEIFEKYRIMANASGEYSAYQSFMDAEIYDMALDSLIRTVGRCEKYMPDAQVYGCTTELTNVKNGAVGALEGFGVTEERALELYAIEDRTAYSAQLYAILAVNGYVTE